MAYEIGFGYTSGATLTYGAYRPEGSVRTAAGTSVVEVSSTGYYKQDDANVKDGDMVIVKDASGVVLWFRYTSIYANATLGQELVANGGFDADSDWAKQDATIADGVGVISPDGISRASLTQEMSQDFVVGTTYRVEFDVSDYTIVDGGLYFSLKGGAFAYADWLIDADGHYTLNIEYSAGADANTVWFFTDELGGPTGSAKIDNVSVKEIIPGLTQGAVDLVKSIPINTFNSGGGTKLI